MVELDTFGKPVRLHEKPKAFKSNYAITGLYFYDNQVLDIAASIKPSARGELEITDVNQAYLDMGQQKIMSLLRNKEQGVVIDVKSVLDQTTLPKTIAYWRL